MDTDAARDRLAADKQRVEGLIREMRNEIDGETESEQAEPDYGQHPADSGSETFEREKDISILDGLETELAEIEAAIERIDAGTYGIDEVTGAPDRPRASRRRSRGAYERRRGRDPRADPLAGARARAAFSSPGAAHYDPLAIREEEHAMGFAIEKVGHWTEGPEFKVEADRTKAYAAATNDPIAAHQSGELAPPVFAVVPIWDTMAGAMAEVTPPEVLMFVVHGEQDMRFHEPIRPGMVLRSKAAVIGIHVKPNGTTVVVKVETTDENGTLVVEQYMTSFFRGVSEGESAGEEAPGHKLTAETKAADPVGSVTQHLDDDQTYRYADASGDRMPIHLDAEVAVSVGLPGHHHPRPVHDGVHVVGRDPRGVRRRPDPAQAPCRALLAAGPARAGHHDHVLERRPHAQRSGLRIRDPQRRWRSRDQGRPRGGRGLAGCPFGSGCSPARGKRPVRRRPTGKRHRSVSCSTRREPRTALSSRRYLPHPASGSTAKNPPSATPPR